MIDIRLFGPLCLRAGDLTIGPRDFGGVKPKQLLEILLLARGRPVAKDRLADLLWGEDLPRNVCATLETYVSVLRRRLGALPGGAGLILTESGAYRLAASRYHLDLDRFDALAAEIAAAPPGRARPLLQGALALVEGEVLADEPYADWARETRDAYRERHTDLLLRGAQAALVERDLHAALAHADRAVEVAPLSERGWRVSMVALYALSRRSSALRAFERCQTLLSEELCVDPSAETLALCAAIRRQEDPETLLPPAEPPIPAADSRPPAPPVRPLFGRSEVLAQVAGLVDEALAGAFSMVLIEGEGGMGKTRLLEEAVRGLVASGRPVRLGTARGHRLERRLPGVFVVEALRNALAGVEGLEELLVAAAARRGGAGWVALERLAATVAEAAPIVLVLDDIHYADPVSLSVLAFLSRRCRNAPVAVLASARPEEVSGDHPLRRLEPEARLRLEVIRRDQVPDLCPALWSKTGGHPQLLAECVAAGMPDGRDGWPQALVEVVLARSQEAGPRAHRILVTASVFARPFRAEDLAAVLSTSPMELVEELERLCERRFLRVEGSRFAFRYEAVREILLASMSPARRQLLTRRTRPAEVGGGTVASITRLDEVGTRLAAPASN